MRPEAVEQYSKALKAGQKFYKNAVVHGDYPYPLVLDEILQESAVAGYADLGTISIPTDLIIGTKSAGRTVALSGNFMPLLEIGSEFASKWISLCDAHLREEGIRDAIECYEFLGRFYVQEGNKRLSVLLSYHAPTISAHVIRVIPRWSEDHEIQVYYEFMHFYSLSGQYTVAFHHRGAYARLQAALGFDPEHIWTESERRSFTSGFHHFREALEKLQPEKSGITAAEALLVWLQIFSFSEIKELSLQELGKRLEKLWPDVLTQSRITPIELSTEPDDRTKPVLSRILSIGHQDHLNIAFLYAYPREYSLWTRAHDEGREFLEKHLGNRVSVKTYYIGDRNYSGAVEAAIQDGAELIFATAAQMISACRKYAALYSDIRFLNCALFQPYTGVRMYGGRTYECKFITGAIAGAMAEGGAVGYVANNPIFGTPASVNAFALGVRMTNPEARIRLDWACLPGDPVQRLHDAGISVISNRETTSPDTVEKHFELGTFRLQPDGSLQPLAAPFWNWGELYTRIVLSIFSGAWDNISSSKAINYWWGMASGVLDVRLSSSLPEGVQRLGNILRNGIKSGSISPLQARIYDQNGLLRSDGSRDFTPEEIISMDWFCDNVDGQLPGFDELLPEYSETVRILGLYRQSILPEAEGGQL